MTALISEMEDLGLEMPNFKNSNFSLMWEFAKMKGKHFSKDKKKIILIIDGLGYDTLVQTAKDDKLIKEFIDRNSMEKISTIFPSFTPSVIISLNSGKMVGEHGIIGNFFSKEYESMVNPFRLSWMQSKEEGEGTMPRIMPETKLLGEIKKRGRFIYVMRESVLEKLMNSEFCKNLEIVPHTGNEDLFVKVKGLLKENFEFLYAYTDILDHFSHAYSKSSDETKWLAKRLIRDIMELESEIKKQGCELFVFSDHGQIVMKKRENIMWNDRFMGFLEMPVFGNSRSFFMKIKPGKEKAFEDYFKMKYSKKALLLDSDELIQSGVFGTRRLSEFARYNVADKAAIALGNNSFHFINYLSSKKNHGSRRLMEFTGTHGGMSPEEMEIPLLRIG